MSSIHYLASYPLGTHHAHTAILKGYPAMTRFSGQKCIHADIEVTERLVMGEFDVPVSFSCASSKHDQGAMSVQSQYLATQINFLVHEPWQTVHQPSQL